MAYTTQKPIVFKVERQEPELITPTNPTPREFKLLSDIDDQDGLRVQIPLIHFYNYHPSMGTGKDPVKVFKESLAKTLNFYYPFAGRIREARPNRKLGVDCNGEGAMFVEAVADISIEELGGVDGLRPPFPCFDQLLFDVPGSSGIINCPILLFQMTRLKCGGIALAIRLNHAMSDASGLSRFMMAISEIARGAEAPSVLPVWERHILTARDPPRVTCIHHEYENLVDDPIQSIPMSMKSHRSFFFGPTDLFAISQLVVGNYSTYELLTAYLWRCRTIALHPDPNEEVRIIGIVNARNKFDPPISKGYYGNCTAYSVAISSARDLCNNPLEYAIELVRKTKRNVTEEYMRSVADLMVIKGRPWYTMARSYLVSDVTRVKFREIDFGWGKAIFGGPAKGHVASFHIAHRNKNGEEGILVTLCLPIVAMERFVKELNKVCPSSTKMNPIMSSM